MRVLLTLLILVLAAGQSANATLIQIDYQIDYTGTYSGTVMSGNPATGQISTVHVDPTPFSLTFLFDTLTPQAFYTEASGGSGLCSGQFGPSAGRAS